MLNFVGMKQCVDLNRLIGVFGVAIIVLLSYLFPSGGVVEAVLLSAATWFAAERLYRGLGATERGGYTALLVFWLLLSVGCVLNCWWFTTANGGTPENPTLYNNDAQLAWAQMLSAMHGGEGLDLPARRGYGYLLAWLSWGSVPSILPLVWLNALAVLVSIILTGASAARMAEGSVPGARMSTLAMIFTGGVCYFLTSGTILIKDAFSCLIMAMCLYGFYGARRRLTAWLLVSAALLLAVPVRSHLLVFIAIAGVCSLYRDWRGRVWLVGATAVAGGVLYILVRNYLGDIPVASDGTTNLILQSDSSRLNAYNLVAGDYDSPNGTTAWYHIVHLPFSLAVQYLTPLPWAYIRDTVFGPTLLWSHISYPWYALGGILLYVLFFRLRRAPREVASAMIFAVTATILTAYATGGTVSRYCLPWLPFFVPAAAWFVGTGGYRCRGFVRWAVCYAVVLAGAMIVVYYFINTYSPGGWEAS